MEKTAIRKLGDTVSQFLGTESIKKVSEEYFVYFDWEILKDGNSIWYETYEEKIGLLNYLKDLENYKVTVWQKEMDQYWEVHISMPCGGLLLINCTEPII